LIYHIEVM